MNLKFWKRKSENDEPAKGSPDSEEAPAKAGWFTRIKVQVAALIGRFGSPTPFKAEVPDDGTEPSAGKDGLPESEKSESKEALPESEAVPAANALARARALLMLLAARLRGVPEGETPPAGRVALIIAGMLLLLLLLGAFGYAAWTIVLSSPDPEADVSELIADDAPLPIVMPESAPLASDVQAASAVEGAASAIPVAESQGDQPASAVAEAVAGHPASSVAKTEPVAAPPVPRKPMTEVEMLRQKNAELQAELDALRKSQRSSAAVKMYPGSRGAPAGGVATVGSSDPAATAATLKEAIEAMNNGKNYQQAPTR